MFRDAALRQRALVKKSGGQASSLISRRPVGDRMVIRKYERAAGMTCIAPVSTPSGTHRASPAMIRVDAPERNVCVACADRHRTPLQASVFERHSDRRGRPFCERTNLKEGAARSTIKIRWAFRLVTPRHPTPKELAVLKHCSRNNGVV